MVTRRDFIIQSGLAVASLTGGKPFAAGSQSGSASLRAQLAADVQRPQYHFLPAANWMNDPNGPIYWKGYYHLFYQHNPDRVYWGDMRWGHARSKDMVHWEHLPVALAPTPGSPDKDGCWSGSAFINHGVPTLVYTGVRPEVQCLATSDDSMVTWKKFSGNPIVSSPPSGLQVNGFRDPTIWRESDAWLMTVGSGFKDQGGAVLLYSSQDLARWEYLHPLFTGRRVEKDPEHTGQYDPVGGGEMWECPDFFPLDRKYCLLVSTEGRVSYFTGWYSGRKFQREFSGLVDGSDLYYAAKSFADRRGRRVLWGWIKEARSDAAQRQAGWAGVMSLPRVLSTDAEGNLCINPLPELAMLRGKQHRLSERKLSGFIPISEIKGDCVEIHLELEASDAGEVGIAVRRSDDSAEETTITYDAEGQNIVLDTKRSSLNPDIDRNIYKSPLTLRPGEPLRLTVFVDASVVEVFANSRACLTGRIYPTRKDSVGLGIFTKGSQAKLKSMEVFEIKAISRNRLTTGG